MTFEVTDNPMNLHLLSFNHALTTYFDFTKIWANRHGKGFTLLCLESFVIILIKDVAL